MRDFKAYVICTSPRSGSTLLCKLLEETGAAGCPDSHFHEPSVEAWTSTYAIPHMHQWHREDLLSKIFAAGFQRGKGKKRTVRPEAAARQRAFFFEQLRVLHPEEESASKRFEAEFGHTAYIYLKRGNKIEQAISNIKAEQSGLWHIAPDGSAIEQFGASQPFEYRFEDIRLRVDKMRLQDEEWKRWFQDENISPHQITYEDLAESPRRELKSAMAFLGLEYEEAPDFQVPVAKLADGLSQEWAERYLEDEKNRLSNAD